MSLKFNEYSIKMCISYFAEGPKIIFLLKLTQNNIKKIVTIQPPPNQLANIDFDVIGTSDY